MGRTILALPPPPTEGYSFFFCPFRGDGVSRARELNPQTQETTLPFKGTAFERG